MSGSNRSGARQLNMNTALPLVALGIAVLSLLLAPRPEVKTGRVNFLPSILLIIVSVGPGIWWRELHPTVLPASLAFGGAVLLSLLLRMLEGARETSSAVELGLAAGIAGLVGWIDPAYVAPVQMAGIAGLGLGAWVAGDWRERHISMPTGVAIFAAVIISADFLGQKALSNSPGATTGTMLGLAGAVAALIALVANRSEKRGAENLVSTPKFIAVAILMILGFVVGYRLVASQEAWMIFLGAVVAAVVLHWTIRPDGKDDSLAFLIGAVIWIGIATLSFAFLKGYGMAIASVGAVMTLMILGNPRALCAAGPLLGLTFYRVLRESHGDAVRALDIGQHYAVIGVAFGLIVPLLPSEWLGRRLKETTASLVGRTIWALTLGLLPAGMAVVLGAKGIVGFVAGLGIAGLLEGVRNRNSIVPLIVASALSALVVVGYDWFAKLLDLTRQEKQIAFFWIAGITVVLALLIAIASRPDREETVVQTS
jgi:hypothetical protein